MRHFRAFFSVVVFASLVAVSAAMAVEVPQERLLWALGGVPEGSVDHRFARKAEIIPGFAGFYLDAERQPTVVLVDPRSAPIFERLGYRVKAGDYDFRQLLVWRMAARKVLGLEGVVFLDIDEVANRLRIGVDREMAAMATTQVEATLAVLGIPAEAVIIEATEPIVLMTTLQCYDRPVSGAMQINFGNYVCTLGFNANRDDVVGFVTNSHCSDKQGEVTDTIYYQPSSLTGQIGVELVDPPYVRGLPGSNCPQNRRCRYSDSLFASYENPNHQEMAGIARTTERHPTKGTLEIDSANWRFTITSTGTSLVNDEVNKIGRTTGWTYGDVTQTCFDTAVSGSNIVQLCQNRVEAGVEGGDSGSPVFARLVGEDNVVDENNVQLRGILWGGSLGGGTFVYSPFDNITRSDYELGPLDVLGADEANGKGDPGNGDDQATTMTVSITASERVRGPWRSALVTVHIHDDIGNPVANATVSGVFTGDVTGEVTGATDSNGTVTFESERVRTNTLNYEFCVADVVHETLVYVEDVNTCPSP